MLQLEKISFVVSNKENGKTTKKEILKDVSLTISDGEFVVITGPNGSGKSTLAKIIMGIIKPTSGKVILDGKDITNLDITKRAKLGLSFAFQQPVRFKGITVKDLIELASGKELNIAEACEYLSDVGLCAREYVNREVDGSLSGGELKRIEIAQMVARKSKLNIFDEPEAGIDLWSFSSLTNVFKRLAEKSKSSTLIISHQERIINVADRVVVLNGGKITKEGTPDNVLNEISLSPTACQVLEGKNA